MRFLKSLRFISWAIFMRSAWNFQKILLGTLLICWARIFWFAWVFCDLSAFFGPKFRQIWANFLFRWQFDEKKCWVKNPSSATKFGSKLNLKKIWTLLDKALSFYRPQTFSLFLGPVAPNLGPEIFFWPKSFYFPIFYQYLLFYHDRYTY